MSLEGPLLGLHLLRQHRAFPVCEVLLYAGFACYDCCITQEPSADMAEISCLGC